MGELAGLQLTETMLVKGAPEDLWMQRWIVVRRFAPPVSLLGPLRHQRQYLVVEDILLLGLLVLFLMVE